ncbi:MAG: T9SS type A sorting domain-containing protein [Bacteroidia bacterium]
MKKIITIIFFQFLVNAVGSSSVFAQYTCNNLWRYTVPGYQLIKKSLHTVDMNNDGIEEIICAAYAYGTRGYWYVLEFDSATNNYDIVWTSELFEEDVTTLDFLDMYNNGNRQIAAGLGDGSVVIYDAFTKNILARFSIPSYYDITHIEYGDVDNDGMGNFVAGTKDTIYVYDKNTFSLIRKIPYGGQYFKIGNVDTDPALELMTSTGLVLSVNGSNIVTQWQFNTIDENTWVEMELSDIDNDGIKELLVAQTSSIFLDAYDVDTQNHKYQVTSSSGMNSFTVKDVTGDGIDELIYGDGQWGEVHCINAMSLAQLWQITNPDNGVRGMQVADVNNDGQLEVIWSSNHIFIGNITTQAIVWQTLAIHGPFYGIAIDDIDNDGINEIVSVSIASENLGAGIISVFNALTHDLEWQSTPTFFPQTILTGIWGCKIADIDNDGDKEIIICTGKGYTGAIYIIDGQTKTIVASHLYTSENFSEFHMFDVADVDNDNYADLIVQCDDSIYVIDPITFLRKWSSASLENSTYYMIGSLAIGNVTGASNKQIVVAQRYLHILDPVSSQHWQSTDKYYAATLYDFDNDGLQEIVAANDSGKISIINGITHQVIHSFQPVKSRINGILVSDLNNDTIPEYIFTSEGTVYFYADSFANIFTENYGEWDVGRFSSLHVADADSNGNYEVYFGSQVSLMELSSECYHCTWFRNEAHKTNRTCVGNDDGSILINTSGGTMPYSYSWNNGATTSSLTGLPVGTYIVNITDNSGCAWTDTFEVAQSQLLTQISGYDIDCHNNPGGASVGILEGTPPFVYQWSNGQTTDTISVSTPGNYYVQTLDSNSCVSSDTIFINKDSLGITVYQTGIKCHGDTIAWAFVNVIQGVFPFSFQWSTGATTDYVTDLSIGNYTITVTDSRGCLATAMLNIFDPPEIKLDVTSTRDDPNTSFGEGTATVGVTGGVSPYHVLWNDALNQTSMTAVNLVAGKYLVEITDSLGCSRSAIVIVDSVGRPEVVMYPTPAKDKVYFDFRLNSQSEVQFLIVNTLGQILYNQQVVASNFDLLELDIAKLAAGLYHVNVIIGENKYYFKLEKI